MCTLDFIKISFPRKTIDSRGSMLGQNSNELPYNYPSDFQVHQYYEAAFLPIPEEHDSLSALRSELGYTSSGCSSYGGSPTSYGGAYSCPTVLQRSLSSHSLGRNSEAYYPIDSSPPSLFFELDETTSVRKAISTGDLMGVSFGPLSSSPVATESSIIESMNRANPYSPEEKKERIERYRNKRNLRNFNKKIKYECRKTLADSRPRIRGRFARNDEMDNSNHNKSAHENGQGQLWDLSHLTGVEEYDEEDENWIGFLDAFSANVMP